MNETNIKTEDVPKFIIEHIDEMKKIQFKSGSKDSYGQGVYNGMEVLRANLSGTEPKFMNKDFTITNLKE